MNPTDTITVEANGDLLIAQVNPSFPGSPRHMLTLDRDELADTIHVAIEEEQRDRGVIAPQTTWWDAAAAADLLLHHIAATVNAG